MQIEELETGHLERAVGGCRFFYRCTSATAPNLSGAAVGFQISTEGREVMGGQFQSDLADRTAALLPRGDFAQQEGGGKSALRAGEVNGQIHFAAPAIRMKNNTMTEAFEKASRRENYVQEYRLVPVEASL